MKATTWKLIWNAESTYTFCVVAFMSVFKIEHMISGTLVGHPGCQGLDVCVVGHFQVNCLRRNIKTLKTGKTKMYNTAIFLKRLTSKK